MIELIVEDRSNFSEYWIINNTNGQVIFLVNCIQVLQPVA